MQRLALACRSFSARRSQILITGNGTDRLGIVRDLSAIIWERQGNILASTMARLSGQFVILMLADVPNEAADDLPFDLARNKDLQGLNLTLRLAAAEQSPVSGGEEWRLDVQGADNPGVIHSLTEVLCRHGINITNLRTYSDQAPLGGALLFRMQGTVQMPSQVNAAQVQAELTKISSSLGVDTQFVAK